MGFQKAREKCGMTQREVAAAIGIDQSAVSLWETGRTAPRASILVKLAKLYGVSVDELLSESEAKQ